MGVCVTSRQILDSRGLPAALNGRAAAYLSPFTCVTILKKVVLFLANNIGKVDALHDKITAVYNLWTTIYNAIKPLLPTSAAPVAPAPVAPASVVEAAPADLDELPTGTAEPLA